MQDRFKFRGLSKGKLYYGAYFKHLPYTPYCGGKPPEKDYKHLIIQEGFSDWGLPRSMTCIEVEKDTVGQCTGLKDKNGELVYFDDFIKLDDGIICIVKQIDDINDIEYGKVIAIPVFCFNKKYQTRYIPTVISESEKVGNLYENPELLEQTKADPFEHC